MLARSIAFSLREQALTALGDQEQAAQVATERAHSEAERSAAILEPAAAMTDLKMTLLETDQARLHAYLGAIQRFGEVAGARLFLRQELPPLLEQAGLLERPGARECVAQFFVEARRARAGQQAQVADTLHVALRSPSRGGQTTVRIRPDGKITLPFVPGTGKSSGKEGPSEREIVAAGKTTDQLQREISTALAQFHRSAEIQVTLLSPGSAGQLRLEFSNAQRDAAGRRSDQR